MADKLVIYNPESNDASHTPSDTVKGDITIDGTVKADTVKPTFLNLGNKYNFYFSGHTNKVMLEPIGEIRFNNQRYEFGGEEGIAIERNVSSSPNVIYCKTTDPTANADNQVLEIGIQETGELWGKRWRNNGRPEYQYMLSEYIDTLTTGNLTSGWTRLQNGLLLQWGTAISDKTGYASFTYPTAFTKVCKLFTILRAEWGTGDNIPVAFPDLGQETVSHNNLTVGGVICRQVNGSSGVTHVNGGTCDWFAIGY